MFRSNLVFSKFCRIIQNHIKINFLTTSHISASVIYTNVIMLVMKISSLENKTFFPNLPFFFQFKNTLGFTEVTFLSTRSFSIVVNTIVINVFHLYNSFN